MTLTCADPDTSDYSIRPMRAGEEAALFEIDIGASILFADVGIAEIAAISDASDGSPDDFLDKLSVCEVIVACDFDDRPVGFTAFDQLDGGIYIRELGVLPQHARRGLGSALLDAVLQRGRALHAGRCVLSTFRDVAFNAPFYRRYGFAELPMDEASAVLHRRFEAEVPEGTRPELRLLMMKAL
ncbi:GNAT family N-acetyltransferase [Hoeflea sp. TYP-13]|uniref:GNAT family N-acetyltransferase n=1 Tax=Hoeflea sp. TYP-13 TaxID=3230023 RepID=UPI0034C66B10